jgi:prophage tail gpP-like protein
VPDPSLVATVKAGGLNYTAWKSVMVRRDCGAAISVFQFTAAEPGPYGQGWDDLRLKPGTPVQVQLGGVQVINGSVTARVAAYDAWSHDLVIAGRSLTANLRSSVQVQPGSFDGYTFEQANKGIMAPFGVGLVIQNAPDIVSKPFIKLAVQYGESVLEFLERTSKMRGMFLTDDKDGNVVAGLGPSSQTGVAELVEGGNMKRAVGKLLDEGLWSRLSLVSQYAGDDQNRPPRDVSATVQNPNGDPNHTVTIIAEHPGQADEMQARANLEAMRSLWPCVEVEVTVAGWFRSDGKLWGRALRRRLRGAGLAEAAGDGAPQPAAELGDGAGMIGIGSSGPKPP